MESKRLIYSELTLKDSEDIFEIRSNDDVMKFMDRTAMKSIEESETYIKKIIKDFKNQNGINWGIVEKSSDKLVGYFGFWRIIAEHCRAEIGYALKSKYQGNGYMRETLETMLDFGFNKLKLHSIEANVNPDNKLSIKLLEKFRFAKEAYLRENVLFNNKFMDSIIYSLLETDLVLDQRKKS